MMYVVFSPRPAATPDWRSAWHPPPGRVGHWLLDVFPLSSQDLSNFSNGRTHHHGDESHEKGRFRLPVCHDLSVCYDGRILPSSN